MFQNKIVMITGAASGIGLEASKQFIENRATVIGADIDITALAEARKTLGARFVERRLDVTNIEEIIRVSESVQKEFKRLDILVNNAGIASMCPLADMKETDYARHFDVLVKGAMFVTKHFVPLLLKSTNPCIINVSSSTDMYETPNHFLYGAAKAALTKFSRHLVRDFLSIRTNTILPGIVETPIYDKGFGMKPEDIKPFLDNAAKTKVPAGRIGTPRDIANCILFVASEKASYINGAEIVVDGGLVRTFFDIS